MFINPFSNVYVSIYVDDIKIKRLIKSVANAKVLEHQAYYLILDWCSENG